MKFTKKKVIAGVSAALLAGTGVAVAAVVLTSDFTGTATAQTNTENASDRIESVSVAEENGVECTVQNVTNEGFRLDAKATETVVKGEGGTTDTIESLAGNCVVTMKLKNTGEVPLEVKNAKLTQAPSGWSIVDLHGTGKNVTFQPEQTVTVQGTLKATDSAETGQLKGEVLTQPKS